MNELRAGVVGAGMIGGVHVNAYTATPGVRVVAVADPVATKAARLATQVGAEVVLDVDRLLEMDLDVVSICTPSPTHTALAVTALQAGLHVLCEKPIARSLDDARQLVAAAEASAGILMVGHVSRFEPDHARAKDIIDAGQLGQVQTMSHSLTTSMPGWSEGGWLGDLDRSGGPLVDLGIHSFDFLSWATGDTAVRVQAVGADTAVGREMYVLTTVRYASGAMALVETSWAHPVSHGFQLAAEIVGTDGRLSWDYDQLAGGAFHSATGPSVSFDPLGERGFEAEIGAFVGSVRAQAPSPVPAAEALTSLRTALAAQESLRTGQPVDLTHWGLA